MTDITVEIAANIDDGFCNQDESNYTNTCPDGLYIGNLNNYNIHVFLRFANVTIPAGASIDSAVVRFTAYQGRSAQTGIVLSLDFEDADDPAAPSSGADVVGRSLTGNPVAWTPDAAWTYQNAYDTDDLSVPLQAVIDRGGWASGQAVIFNLKNNGGTAGNGHTAYARNASTSYSADLVVTYSIPNIAEDDFTIDDSVDAFSLTDEIQDQFEISDEITASGGSTEAAISDDLTISDTVISIKEVQGDIPDALTIDDSASVLAEFHPGADDDLNISDLTDGFLWSEWLRENYGKYAIRYYCTLTGDADNESDLEIKQSSFQATKRNGAATYLSVVIPGFEYSSGITARSNGDLKIDMAYLVDGVESLRENIIDVALETIRTDEGPRRRSISLSGSRTVDYKGNLITIENPIYKNVSDGKIRYRFLQPDPWLNAGDTVKCRSDEFVVDYITYTISDRFKQMEIRET